MPGDAFVEASGPAFQRVASVMRRLRAPDGCPWDREQTHESLARHLLEETYEVLEAIDAGDLPALREELGDLVLQVIFHSEIAFETGAFSVADVMDDLAAKLVRRHPHVFGDLELAGGPGGASERKPPGSIGAEEVYANWERMKRGEKGTGVTDGIPAALPALAETAKLKGRTAQVGFDFSSRQAWEEKLHEELRELAAETDPVRVEEEAGDVLFVAAALVKQLGVEPETALRKANRRFVERFRALEARARAEGRELESLSPEEWGEYWKQAKPR